MPEDFDNFCATAERDLASMADGGMADVINRAREVPVTWHPNGFVVFELGQRALGLLRLHIWPRGERPMRNDQAHIHTHVWDLCSRVLAGVYSERLYEVGADGEGVECDVADVDYARDRNTLMVRGKVVLSPVSTVTVGPSEVHTVRAGVAHETVIPPGRFTATLLLTSMPRTDLASVYSRAAFPPSAGHARSPVGDSFRGQLLEELEARMEVGT